ncbi:hypothetical protein [uncultured Stenotrophomonas sp.]|uniref:hypothetical protein n=1 Tax=uncultured Stenotrophomonas sp. TaxID=165438 RepID=UPI0028EC3B4F|nr:hypothetical protein [uncultured Stenotrophomonas sp.]
MPNPNEAAQAATPAPDTDQTVAEQVEAPATEQLDAFSAGVEEARAAETADAAPVVPPPTDDAAAVVDPSAPAAPVEGEGGDPAAAPAAEPKPDAAQSVDDEIKDLGITNERTQKRFRELSERASEAESLRERAAKVDGWEDMVKRTGTTPEQFGAAMVYLTDINSGDPVRMGRAYDTMQAELKYLGEKLGREAPGFDPLTAHPDLAEKVASGDLERAAAVELVQHRQRGVLQNEQQQNQHRVTATQQAEQQGLQAVHELGQQLKADPQFQQKFAFLAPTIDIIQATMPPAQWAPAIQQAYQRLPAIPAAAPAVAARPNNPARASAAPAVPATPKNPTDAFAFGVAEAQAQGR